MKAFIICVKKNNDILCSRSYSHELWNNLTEFRAHVNNVMDYTGNFFFERPSGAYIEVSKRDFLTLAEMRQDL